MTHHHCTNRYHFLTPMLKWILPIFLILLYLIKPDLLFAANHDINALNIELEDSVISRLYLALLDRDVENALKPDFHQGDEPIVEMAQMAAGFSFAYYQQGSKFFQDPIIEEAILRIIQPIYKYQLTDGSLVLFGNKKVADHHVAQIIEAFIYISPITAKYTEAIQKEHEAFINNGLSYLSTIQTAQMNYHKAIFCGVLALGADYTNDESYQNEAETWLTNSLEFFDDNGQVLEGPGPDLIHSITSIRYMFLYRLLTDDASLDPTIKKSLQWITRLFTVNTIPLEGMSTENWVDQGNHLATLLAAFTFYEQEDSFQQYATYYINTFIDSNRPVTFIDSGFTFLKAAQYHNVPEQLEEIPYEPYAELYESDHSLYCLVGKNYQTAITLRGRLPLKGLQTWSYLGQDPIIFPRPDTISGFIQFGFDSSRTDILWNQTPETYKLSSPSKSVDLLVVHQDLLETAYLFTQDSTVVLYRIPEDQESVIQWNTNSYFGAIIKEGNENRITFENSQAGIIPPNILPNIIQDGHNRLLRYSLKNNSFWFTFAGPNTNVIIRPVRDGLIFVQIIEKDKKNNILVNLSHIPFDKDINYPGTSIPVPPVDAMTAKVVD